MAAVVRLTSVCQRGVKRKCLVFFQLAVVNVDVRSVGERFVEPSFK